MPAQSPTLSPTLSAIVAALRGSSSGMPCSTLPTRSAPTSAALVKMPPPTRMNMASSAAPKPKPSSTVGGVALVDEDDEGGAEQAEADGEHAGDAAGAERDPHRLLRALDVAGGRGDAHVAAHREPHAHVAGDGGEQRADDEEDRPADPLAGGVGREQEEQEEHEHGEDRERPELPAQVRRGALLDGLGDLLHAVGALVGGEHLAHEEAGDAQRPERDDRHDDDDRQVASPRDTRSPSAARLIPDIGPPHTFRS